MVAAKDDDGVFVEAAVLQHVEKFADAIVNVAHSAVVGSSRSLDLLLAKFVVPQVADFQQSFAVSVLLFLGNVDLGKLDVDPLVEVPVLLLDSVRVMGVREGNLSNSQKG
jgi:hypothetical protein